jgi:hypothetical protein
MPATLKRHTSMSNREADFDETAASRRASDCAPPAQRRPKMTNTIITQSRPEVSPTPERSMSLVPEFIRRHPVVTFYVVAFAISWSGISLVIGGPGNFPGSPEQVGNLFLELTPFDGEFG